MDVERPNILLIFTDQQRADTIAAFGNSVIRTPNLDRLCRDGVVFSNAYTPSPVCVPARCSMMYGQYPANTGCYDNGDPMPEEGRASFITHLSEAGYCTHGIGKCHFTPDPQAMRGFQARLRQEEMVESPDVDEYLKFLHDEGFSHICDPFGARGEMYYVPQVAQMPARLHPTQWVGDRTLEFLEKRAGSSQPWFCFASFVHPHPPFSPPNPWHKLYRAPLMPLPNVPQNNESLLTYINRYQNRYKFRDQGIDQNLVRCMKAFYYATISFVDKQIGRILDTLDKNDQLDNTLILFSSDHGELLGDYNCFGKRSMHDASARIPLIARLPDRFEGGTVCCKPVNLVDIAPTCLSVAEVEMKDGELDGVDLADISANRCERKIVFSQFRREGLATYVAVSERWKYFFSAPDQREYLFDRSQDPLETRNRAGLALCSELQSDMKYALMEHLKKNNEI